MPNALLMLAVVCALAAASWLLPTSCTEPHALARIAPDDSHIRYLGRFEPLGHGGQQGQRFGWPASQIDARFIGPSLSASLAASPRDPSHSELDRLLVQVDEEPPRVFRMAPGEHIYPLAQGLGPGPHRVKLWKQTEGDVGTLTFRGFLLAPSGTLLPKAEEPALHLEAVGDSVTAGFGALGRDPCRELTRYQSSYDTFTAVAARELSASYTAIAASGRGVLRNFDGEGPGDTLPALYDRLLPRERAQMPHEGGHEGRKADAVIVELGTNDFIAGVPDAAAFTQAYAALLTRIRARHPRALLVLVIGPLLDDRYPQPRARSLQKRWLTQLASQLRAAEPGVRIDVLELGMQDGEPRGCDQHPGRQTHERLGQELAAHLAQRLRR